MTIRRRKINYDVGWNYYCGLSFGLALASIAIDTNDQVSGRAYSYSLGFVAAILVMLVYANIHGI